MATIVLPEKYPALRSKTVEVDKDVLDAFGNAYCQRTSEPRDADFFYSYLPLKSVQDVFQSKGSPTEPTLAQLLGNVYVSGYFGGGWLIEILFPSSGPRDVEVRDTSRAFLGKIAGLANDPHAKDGATADQLESLLQFLRAILADGGSQYLVDLCSKEVDFAQHASSEDLLKGLPDRLSRLVYLCGYDIGFLRQMVNNKPPDVTLDAFHWGQCLLEFSSSSIDIATDLFENWRGAVLKLLIPPPGDTRWSELAAEQTAGANQQYWAEAIWQLLLNQKTLATLEPSYAILFDLGVKYQLLAQTITLAEMSAWANQDAGAGRLALILETCFILWTGGYLIGLFSGNTDLPTISCSG